MACVTTSASGGAPATWVHQVSDPDLVGELGVGTFARGQAYHRAGAVRALAVDRGGRRLLATVAGSGGRSYQTVITAADDARPGTSGAGVRWTGLCTCPMQRSCKHVVAVLL